MASLVTTQTLPFTVTVVGTDNTNAVLQVDGGDEDENVGTIVQTAVATGMWMYTAPEKAPSSNLVTITATSDADKTQTAKATVTIVDIR